MKTVRKAIMEIGQKPNIAPDATPEPEKLIELQKQYDEVRQKLAKRREVLGPDFPFADSICSCAQRQSEEIAAAIHRVEHEISLQPLRKKEAAEAAEIEKIVQNFREHGTPKILNTDNPRVAEGRRLYEQELKQKRNDALQKKIKRSIIANPDAIRSTNSSDAPFSKRSVVKTESDAEKTGQKWIPTLRQTPIQSNKFQPQTVAAQNRELVSAEGVLRDRDSRLTKTRKAI